MQQCAHYVRHCDVQFPCCDPAEWFACRKCHPHPTEAKPTRMRCRLCQLAQPLGRVCAAPECAWKATAYHCAECALWSDSDSLSYFHCAGCGFCIQGDIERTEHCSRCRACFLIRGQAHRCTANLYRDGQCSLCLGSLGVAERGLCVGQCGHVFHEECWQELLRYGIGHTIPRCPLCRHTLFAHGEFSAWLRGEIRAHPELAGPDDVPYRCNDCQFRGVAQGHHFGIVCTNCLSTGTEQTHTN